MAKKQLGSRAIRNKVRALRKDIPEGIATMAVGFFQESFRKQGFTDRKFKRWQKRKVRDKGRAVLTGTGDLKRSIRKGRVSLRRTVISSKLPYSAIHNEGLMCKAWGKHPFKMPQRKFMGESQKLERKMLKFIYKSIDKSLGF
jgi:phage gpG-like protein